MRRWLHIAASMLASACRNEPKGPNTTLELAPVAVTRGVVAFGQIAQVWHVGWFSPATVTLTDVRAGDAIITLGMYWGDLPKRTGPAPSDSSGTLVAAVDQSPKIIGYQKPPVFAQIHYELGARAGRHVIKPPYLGGPAGDGTFYVIQVRGLTKYTSAGETRMTGTALRDVAVELAEDAAPDDLVVAIGGYDNTEKWPSAEMTNPPPEWTAIGVQNDSSNNVPSQASHRIVPAAGRARVTWTWSDPKVNVACAAIAGFR